MRSQNQSLHCWRVRGYTRRRPRSSSSLLFGVKRLVSAVAAPSSRCDALLPRFFAALRKSSAVSFVTFAIVFADARTSRIDNMTYTAMNTIAAMMIPVKMSCTTIIVINDLVFLAVQQAIATLSIGLPSAEMVLIFTNSHVLHASDDMWLSVDCCFGT